MSLLGRSEDGIRRKYSLSPRLQVTFYYLGVIAVVNLYQSAAGLSYLSRLDSSRPSRGLGAPRSLTLTRGWVWRSPGPWSTTSHNGSLVTEKVSLGMMTKDKMLLGHCIYGCVDYEFDQILGTADSRHSPTRLSSPGLPGYNTT